MRSHSDMFISAPISCLFANILWGLIGWGFLMLCWAIGWVFEAIGGLFDAVF